MKINSGTHGGWQAAGDRQPAAREYSRYSSPVTRRSIGFTLIELLVVIAIMAILAAFTLEVVTQIKKVEYINTATAEMSQIEIALQNYQSKYGTYPPCNNSLSPLYNTLYYELTGVTNNGVDYVTIDGASKISPANYQTAFTAGGNNIGAIINCTKGTTEEGTAAQNFLLGLKANRISSCIWTGSGLVMTNLITSVRGPDISYQPMGTGPSYQDINPFRYLYPGTNNPTSYDLWVQLQYRGKMYLVCNWSKTPIVGSPLP